jgi:hypothetical protein
VAVNASVSDDRWFIYQQNDDILSESTYKLSPSSIHFSSEIQNTTALFQQNEGFLIYAFP